MGTLSNTRLSGYRQALRYGTEELWRNATGQTIIVYRDHGSLYRSDTHRLTTESALASKGWRRFRSDRAVATQGNEQ